MSAKWIRAKQWDDQHLTGWLLPVKWVLRAFSTIPLAVVLLTLVSFYGVLASVPIGLIALAPTWIVYAASAALVWLVLAALPTMFAWRTLGKSIRGLTIRFPVCLIGAIVLSIAALAAWRLFLWPVIHYNASTGSGFRMFGSFVDQYKSVQFRRLPIMEMSELEFYSWWPLRVVLVLFVVNMVVTTIRRIEFRFPYLGVLTVHTGIVIIALGSIYYAAQKQEGDMLLLAGEPTEAGEPTPGPPETGFYDNTVPALWVTQRPEEGWEQRPLRGVPRYNDYNLNALGLTNLPPMARGDAPDRGPISVGVPDGPSTGSVAVDRDVRFRIVGYASHADLISEWRSAASLGLGGGKSGGGAGGGGGRPGSPMRTVEAYLAATAAGSVSGDPNKPRKTWRLMPDHPARRIDLLNVGGQDLLGIEFTRGDIGGRGMTAQRWKDLGAALPKGTDHALVVRHKASGFEQVYPVSEGRTVTVGETGYSLEVVRLSPDAPFPIITRGYEGARSSVAVVRVRPPTPLSGDKPPGFERWIYSRFPEISQDMVDTPSGAAMPGRRAADSDIDIAYVDASILQIYFDELPDGTVRTLARYPRGEATVSGPIAVGQSVEVAPGLNIKYAERIDDAVSIEYPFSTPVAMRDTKSIGNHQRASVAVEVSIPGAPATADAPASQPWSTILWLPFTQYARSQSAESERIAVLPDGRRVRMMFGRVRHEFWPPMGVRLADFEMIPYEHSRTPRDYRSELIVMRRGNDRHSDTRAVTSLNEPLLERAPFAPREEVPRIFNTAAWLLSFIAPNQYKFSQAGWDQGGWTESQAAVDRGEAKRPLARFTILGVGNNPGIYVIAAGAVLMSVGIPWAFYVKPWLIRREKRRIQDRIARGEIIVGRRHASRAEAQNGSGGGAAAPEAPHLPAPVVAAADSRTDEVQT